jgi:hypothetical protein
MIETDSKNKVNLATGVKKRMLCARRVYIQMKE